jgi:hypothetical protein
VDLRKQFINNLINKVMKSKFLILAVISLIAFFIGCEKEKEPCPTNSETITWNSFGNWVLQSEGENGFSNGKDPINLVSDCGWEVLGDEIISGTRLYTVQSHDAGILLTWINGEFSKFQVNAGWTGTTKEGIKIGDSLSDFLHAYPYFESFTSSDPNFIDLYYTDYPDRRTISATFSKFNEKLIYLYVQSFNLQK